jgi:Flp pilus assembly pilin Flp
MTAPWQSIAANLNRSHLECPSMNLVRALWNDETGVVISAELVLVLTVVVLGMVVGLSEVAVAVNTELNDLSNAFGALNQSYCFTGFHAGDQCKPKSFFYGSCFYDRTDDCDLNGSCDLVCGSSSAMGEQNW